MVFTLVKIKPNNHSKMKRLSSQLAFDVTLHGLLLWASLGFLMPLGILKIRMSNKCTNRSGGSSETRARLFFYFHLLLQILSVLLSTAGAVMSIRSLENSFSDNHQRLGLALYFAVLVQAVLGLLRPYKYANRGRGTWYLLHWLLGIVILAMGNINIFTGLLAYQKKTSKSVKLWTILFTAEVSLIGLFYLLQDKWDHIQKHQGMTGDEPVIASSSSDHQDNCDNNNSNTNDSQSQTVSEKSLWREPCSKANGLKNLFY